MAMTSQIVGSGAYLPERIVTNDELAKKVDTSDEWIFSRTGIRERRIAADGEMTSDLALAASKKALESAGIAAEEVDLIVLGTTTPDRTFPATATTVQSMLGLKNGAAFDIQAVCTGFIYALAIADNFVKAGQVRTALVIGAETFSRILDWEDRGTCVLFGDGAGAVVLRGSEAEAAGPDGHGRNSARGILSTHLHSDGRHSDKLYVDGGPSSTQTVGHVRMEGREVFRHAVTNLVLGHRGSLGRQRHAAVRHRLGGAPPSQQADSRRHHAQARIAPGKGGDDRRAPRQHVGRVRPPGPRRGHPRRPHSARRSGAIGSHGRRLHLGRVPGPVVS